MSNSLASHFQEFKRLTELEKVEMPEKARVLIRRAYYCGAATALLYQISDRERLSHEIGEEATRWASGELNQ